MKKCASDRVRNFVLAGAAGSGKTSLAELMLFKSGAIPRLGTVDSGTTVSDFRKEEQERKSSIYSAILNCPWKDGHFFFVDTPGATDFCGEAMNAINTTDMLILVVNAATGIEPGDIRAWRQAAAMNLPRAIFINCCDRDEADFFGKLETLRKTCVKKTSVPYSLPIGEKAAMTGVAELFGEDVAKLGDHGAEARTELVEAIAESDDALMEKYLEELDLSDEDIIHGLRKALREEKLVPIFAGSVAKDIGVTELMDFILQYGPSPLDGVKPNLANGTLDVNSADSTAVVFKSVNDTFIGQMTYMRIYSGTITKDSELVNSTKQSKERIGSLLAIQGKNQENIDSAGPGEIVAVAKLKNTGMLDVLGSKQTDLVFAPINYPQPTTILAISAQNKGEDDKLASGLARLLAEDATMKLERNPETHQTVLYGMGDLQINLMTKRLQSDFRVAVNLETPKVPYRETVKGVGSDMYRHKKQSGGHGQFAEVHLRIEPFTGSTPEEEYQFGNEVVGGAVPKNFIPAIEKGVAETRLQGPLSHSKCINFKCTVFDGKYHPVDSSEMAFKIATRGAFRAAMAKAKPELLEPIMNIVLEFPDEYTGTIQGDLNSRRGRILGMDIQDGLQLLTAELPLAEVYGYPQQLRSMTQGRGSFVMKFDRYDPVPPTIAKKIQEEAAKEDAEEE